MHTVEWENSLRIKKKNMEDACARMEKQYIYIYIYVYYFVGNNGVLLGIKFMFKKKMRE